MLEERWKRYLDETDGSSTLPEALSADVDTVLSDLWVAQCSRSADGSRTDEGENEIGAIESRC